MLKETSKRLDRLCDFTKSIKLEKMNQNVNQRNNIKCLQGMKSIVFRLIFWFVKIIDRNNHIPISL